MAFPDRPYNQINNLPDLSGEAEVEPDKKEIGRRLLSRLMASYYLAREKIQSEKIKTGSRFTRHLDIGMYNGFAQSFLTEMMRDLKVVSIDIDRKKIRETQQRPELQRYLGWKLHLLNMDAMNLSFNEGVFDSVSMIEVLGAGLEGDSSQIEKLFSDVSRVLRPGGIFVYTAKSEYGLAAQENGFWHAQKGIPIARDTLTRLTSSYFSECELYGQIVSEKLDEEWIKTPRVYLKDKPTDAELYRLHTPVQIVSNDQMPLYWVGVCTR